MTSRIVRVGKTQQMITTQFIPGSRPGFEERHEHVTLATPRAITDTQRLRTLASWEQGKDWSRP